MPSSETATEGNNSRQAHGELLDRIYRVTRHVYDITRKYYLFGRDTLLQKLIANLKKPESTLLEVGCGTARNLRFARKIDKRAQLFGLDASHEMLRQATKMASNISPPIALAHGYAEQFNPKELFHRASFDAIFFSYSLSMMPDWSGALDNALTMLEPDGSIWIVDFWDQGGYPAWFASGLKKWLALFHVRFEPKLLEYMESLATIGQIQLHIEPVGRRYAYIAHITLPQ